MIRPSRYGLSLGLAELWRYRELLYFLTWRDLKIRYRQTVLGVAWSVLQPVLMMIVFTVVFSRLARVSTGGIPYPIFVYAGLLPWTFFARAITGVSESVIRSERLITKVYFPRLAIPLAAIGAALADYLIASGVLLALMLYYNVPWHVGLLGMVPLTGLLLVLAIGCGCWLAALNVSYRDVRYLIPFLVQIWLFATPSIYMRTPVATHTARSTEAVTMTGHVPSTATAAPQPRAGEWVVTAAHWLIAWNPLDGLVRAFRSFVLRQPVVWSALAQSVALSCLLFVGGLAYFRYKEATFADVV